MSNRKVILLTDIQHRQTGDISTSLLWWGNFLDIMGYQTIYYDYRNYSYPALMNIVKEQKPIFLLHPTLYTVHEEFAELRKYTQVFIIQSDDTWRYEDFSKRWIPFIDGVITFEGDEQKYRRDGFAGKFCKTIWAYNPTIMFIPDMKTYTKDILASHYGGLHANRVSQISTLRQLGIPVNIYNYSSYVDAVQLLLRSQFSLCFTWNSTMQFREPKGRVSEIPAFRAALLTEDFPGIENYYEPDEYILFNSPEEAKEKILYYSTHSTELEKIVNKAFNRIWSVNNTIYQWNKMLPIIDENYIPVNVDNILNELKQKLWR